MLINLKCAAAVIFEFCTIMTHLNTFWHIQRNNEKAASAYQTEEDIKKLTGADINMET